MTSQAFNFPRFFVTAPSPCPYLPGKVERKVFTELKGADGAALNEALGRIGFRRSQNVAYRPSCDTCNACVSVRVLAPHFQPNRTARRLLRRHDDLVVTISDPWATAEQFFLLQRYLNARHPHGGMSDMSAADYTEMVERSPVESRLYEYRTPGPAHNPGGGELIAVCLTDHYSDGLSMVYSFYTPDGPRRGLGSYLILDHIRRANAAALPYVYLGYWIDGSPRMAYKAQYSPMEQLRGTDWVPLTRPKDEIHLLGS